MTTFQHHYGRLLCALVVLAGVVVWLVRQTTAFARPEALAGLMLASFVLLLLAYEARWRHRQRSLFGELALLAKAGEPSLTPWLLLRDLLLLAALALCLLAAARPKGGLSETDEASEGLDVMICLDVSNSMRARDMGGASRLDVAKQLLGKFIEDSPGDRIGLVGFAGSAHVMCPFTLDSGTLIAFLEDLDYGSVAKQGTRLGDAIRVAAKRFDPVSTAGRVILLLTDGEDQDSDPPGAARDAADRGIVVYTVGLGNASGAKIPMGADFWGNQVTKKYHGSEVTTRLDETTLKSLAEATGGHYYHAAYSNRLAEVLKDIAGMSRTTVKGRRIEIRQDVFTWYLLPALLLLAVEPFCRRRRRRVR